MRQQLFATRVDNYLYIIFVNILFLQIVTNQLRKKCKLKTYMYSIAFSLICMYIYIIVSCATYCAITRHFTILFIALNKCCLSVFFRARWNIHTYLQNYTVLRIKYKMFFLIVNCRVF